MDKDRCIMEKYKTMADFNNTVGVMPIMSAVVTAVPIFFPLTLFCVFIFGTGTSYYMILKSTGKKRFFHSLTAMAFITFLASLIVASMNTATITYLSGYWVGFYIVMTLISWLLLDSYK
jgi:hypothetical protein